MGKEPLRSWIETSNFPETHPLYDPSKKGVLGLLNYRKYSRNISLNASHFILVISRDLSQIETLGRQIFGKEDSKKLETKASIAERFIRTLKGKLYKYMTAHNTLNYMQALPEIVKTYNSSPHKGLKGKTPTEVHALSSPAEYADQFNLMYKTPSKTKREIIPRLAVGDTVRIALSDRISKFKKGFKQQNTREIFTVTRIDRRQRIPLYFLKDLNIKEIEGGFYSEELTPTQLPPSFHIKKILRKRRVREKAIFSPGKLPLVQLFFNMTSTLQDLFRNDAAGK
ncbi:uncharacterized protein [Procambarus clarkii]|uniref:uncharacterized protein n=1 Tax=Procambarus clarkii TaxID=6728 RepID=UPI0037435F48